MKKILVIMMCIIVMCALPVVASAEEIDSAVETPLTIGQLLAAEDLSVDMVVDYVQFHLEEISVIVTLILSVFYNVRKHGKLNKSITTLNNNSVAVAENSAVSIQTSLEGMDNVVATVNGYKDAMMQALEEIRRNDEQRVKLEESLTEVSSYLKATRMANVELADVMAEILLYANIPVSRKDVFYARHLAAVNAIKEAESIIAEQQMEVKENETVIEE